MKSFYYIGLFVSYGNIYTKVSAWSIFPRKQLQLNHIKPGNNCCNNTNNRLPQLNGMERINSYSNLNSHLALSVTGGNVDDGNNGSLNASKRPGKEINTVLKLSLLIASLSLAYLKKDLIMAFDFKTVLREKLDILSNLGTPGLILYTVSFMIWEMTVGVTTPVETAAGMAFGLEKGIIANAIGKTSGAILAFLMGRYLVRDYVTKKLEGNEYMDLVQHSITKHPIRVSLIWRFSFLPEFMKNFGLAVLPVKTWQFMSAVLIHGFPFTVLWTFLGKEMGLVVRGVVAQPSRVLKMMITGVYIFGFFISPSMVGLWVKGLRDEKQRREKSKKDP